MMDQSMEQDNTESLGKWLRNPVHQFFWYDEESDYSYCKVLDCGALFKGARAAYLERHIKNNHESEYMRLEFLKHDQVSKQPQTNSKRKKTSHLEIELSVDDIRGAIMEMVTINARPFSIMGDSGFLKIVNPIIESLSFDEQFVVSPDNIRNMVKDEVKQKIIQEVKGKILHVKVDIACHNYRYFLAIHVQFLKGKFLKLRTLLIKEILILLPKHIEVIIVNTLLDYKIELANVFSFTVDDGSDLVKLNCSYNTNDTVVKVEIMNEVSKSTIESLKQCVLIQEEGDQISSYCITNAYTDVVNDALMKMKEQFIDVIIKVRDFVISKNILSIPEDSLSWIDNMTTTNLTEKPYWILATNMLSKIYNSDEFIICHESHNEIDDDDSQFIRSIIDCFTWIKESLTAMLEKNYTLSEFYTSWIVCKKGLDDNNTPLADLLLIYMNKREETFLSNDMLLASIYLDPRFKRVLPAEKTQQAVETIRAIWDRLEDLEKKKVSCELPISDKEVVQPTPQQRVLENILAEADMERGHIKLDVVPYLDRFQQLPKVSYKKNLFAYWEEKKYVMPFLYELAKVVQAVPASRISMGRLFLGMKHRLPHLKCEINSRVVNNMMTIQGDDDLSVLLFRKNIFDTSLKRKKLFDENNAKVDSDNDDQYDGE